MNDTPDSPDLAVLKAHRHRVADAKNFQEFQEAQLDLLDYLIARDEKDQAIRRALDSYFAKFDEWCNK